MKRFLKLTVMAMTIAVFGFALVTADLYAQNGSRNGVRGAGFVDENGDGYNDLAPDHDGDGIPNRLDPDYVPLNPDREKGHGFIDEDGDGINDRFQDADGDGIPNCEDPDWVKPEDGSGNKFGQKGRGFRGAGRQGSGDCDESGPLGSQKLMKSNRK